MQTVLLIHIDLIVDVFQNKDHTRRCIGRRCNNCVHPKRRMLHIIVFLHIVQQVQPELVQSQVHNGNAARHFFQIDHLIFQPFELCAAIFQIAFFFRADEVIIPCGSHDRQLHPGFHAAFQVDVLIQIHIRPEVDQLDAAILASNAVNAAKTLDNAHRIPVNIIVDQIITVLQVLTFGNAVGGNQQINIRMVCVRQAVPPLGNGRKAGENCIQITTEFGNGCFTIHAAGDFGSVQPKRLLYIAGNILIQIVSSI